MKLPALSTRAGFQTMAMLHAWDPWTTPGVVSAFTAKDGPTFRITWSWDWEGKSLRHASLWQITGSTPALVLVDTITTSDRARGQRLAEWITEYGTSIPPYEAPA